jgi:hypothetical protein
VDEWFGDSVVFGGERSRTIANFGSCEGSEYRRTFELARLERGNMLGVNRPRRWLFRGLSALSVSLFVISIAAWILSDCQGLSGDPCGVCILLGKPSVHYEIDIVLGDISLQSFGNGQPTTLDYSNSHTEVPHLMVASSWVGPGISRTQEVWVKRTSSFGAVLPGIYGTITVLCLALYWPLIISLPMTVLIASKGVRGLLNRRSGRIGVCAKCGYDLRATPGRCPECGAVPPKEDAFPG